MDVSELKRRISDLEQEESRARSAYDYLCSKCYYIDSYDPMDPPEPVAGFHSTGSCTEESFPTEYEFGETYYRWWFYPDGTEEACGKLDRVLLALDSARRQLEEAEASASHFSRRIKEKAQEATESGSGVKYRLTANARRALERLESPEESELDGLFEQMFGVKRFASLPDDDERKQAYLQGLRDRLKMGGLCQFRVLDSGQRRIESYTEDVVARIREGYAPGTSRSQEEVEQLIYEELDLALQQGVVFADVSDMARFAVDLACSAFDAIRKKRAPRGHPKHQNQHKPQDLRQRLRKPTEGDTIEDVQSGRQRTLERYSRRPH